MQHTRMTPITASLLVAGAVTWVAAFPEQANAHEHAPEGAWMGGHSYAGGTAITSNVQYESTSVPGVLADASWLIDVGQLPPAATLITLERP